MMDLFERKNIKPMLIGETSKAFDSPDYIYEIKLDGERCIAYLDPTTGTELRNKRNMKMLPKVPELSEIHKQVKRRCILDGELAVIVDGKPDFSKIQTRSITENKFKIQLQATKYPASFIAYDILYWVDHEVASSPLMERKKLLEDAVKAENDRFAVSRYVEKSGIALYQLTEEQGLEGIVAKLKDSKYYFGKSTKDWIKIKNLQDDDFVICGYIKKEHNVTSLILGQYQGNDLIYKGHVPLSVSSDDFRIISSTETAERSPFQHVTESNKNAVWIVPGLVCKVAYMTKTDSGFMRQPAFRGIRFDKKPEDCIAESL